MNHDFKRGELVVTIGDDIYPKGSIGMITKLYVPGHEPDKGRTEIPAIEVLWFNYKFKDSRQTGWVFLDWVKHLEKEDK